MVLKKFAFTAMLAMALSQSAIAADLVIYLNQATESGVRELAAAFAKATGNKVEVSFQAGAALNEKINSGEFGRPDVARTLRNSSPSSKAERLYPTASSNSRGWATGSR